MRPFKWLVVVLIALALAAGSYELCRGLLSPPSPSAELATPKLALDRVQALHTKPLFFTPAAVPYLKEHWGLWGPAFGTPAISPETLGAQFEATLQSPEAWRVVERKWRFGALLLTGDPSGFLPLLEHLRKTPDWTLTQVDPMSYVFERSPARPWTTAEIPKVMEPFQKRSSREWALARIGLAHRLMYCGEPNEARALLDAVLKADPKSKEGWTELAYLHGLQGHWPESKESAARALALDRRYSPALFAQAQALYAQGRFNDALATTRNLYAAAPEDGPTLLLHARIAHTAHAYQDEIDVLRKVIALVQGRSQPVGIWRIYLGQAYAATGNSLEARNHLKLALDDATLSESNRVFVQKALERFQPVSEPANIGPSLR